MQASSFLPPSSPHRRCISKGRTALSCDVISCSNLESERIKFVNNEGGRAIYQGTAPCLNYLVCPALAPLWKKVGRYAVVET